MHPEPIAPADAGYEDDFYEWTVAQAAAIRDGRWIDLDVENVAEEIESLGRSDRREVGSRLRVMLMHLLKQHVQPERETASWQKTISAQASDLFGVVNDSPSLRRRLPEFVALEYPRVRRKASLETRLSLKRFPEIMPAEIEHRLYAILAENDIIP